MKKITGWAFRVTENLLHGHVSIAPWKWYAKRCAEQDKCGLWCIFVGCDQYTAWTGIENKYPRPNEIIKLKIPI